MCDVCGCRDKAKAKPAAGTETKEAYVCQDCGYSQSKPGSHCGKPLVKKAGGEVRRRL